MVQSAFSLRYVLRDFADLAGLRILVVDDDRESRAVLTAMLSLINVSAVVVGHVQEALEVLDEEPFDLLILDLELPNRSGYELLRIVRRMDEPIVSIPAIAVSGHNELEHRRRCRMSGFAEHLGKPVDLQALFLAIRRSTTQSRRARDTGIDADATRVPRSDT